MCVDVETLKLDLQNAYEGLRLSSYKEEYEEMYYWKSKIDNLSIDINIAEENKPL